MARPYELPIQPSYLTSIVRDQAPQNGSANLRLQCRYV